MQKPKSSNADTETKKESVTISIRVSDKETGELIRTSTLKVTRI